MHKTHVPMDDTDDSLRGQVLGQCLARQLGVPLTITSVAIAGT